METSFNEIRNFKYTLSVYVYLTPWEIGHAAMTYENNLILCMLNYFHKIDFYSFYIYTYIYILISRIEYIYGNFVQVYTYSRLYIKLFY